MLTTFYIKKVDNSQPFYYILLVKLKEVLNMAKSNNSEENFYIALPNVHDEELIIVKNGIFEKCCVKCGEALSQTVEDRLPQEAHNSGSMACIYKFYIYSFTSMVRT